MHKEKEQHNLWLVGQIYFLGQIYIFGIFQKIFLFGKKTTPRVHLLCVIVVTLPVSHLDKSELKADASLNAARSATTFKENDSTPHKKTQQVQQ